MTKVWGVSNGLAIYRFNLLLIIAGAIMCSDAWASCTCKCVDGEMQPLCQNSFDVPPVCPPAVCSPVPPSVAPIMPPTVPPIGATSCHPAQVCDQYGNCRWQKVCD